MIKTFFSSGVRVGACCRIKKSDVTWKGKTKGIIEIKKAKGLKGGKFRKVCISESLCTELKKYIDK